MDTHYFIIFEDCSLRDRHSTQDGKFLSNTYALEHGLDWFGILIEPLPEQVGARPYSECHGSFKYLLRFLARSLSHLTAVILLGRVTQDDLAMCGAVGLQFAHVNLGVHTWKSI